MHHLANTHTHAHVPQMAASPQIAVDLSDLAPDLGRFCERYLRRYRRHLSAAVERGESGISVCRTHARILDGLFGALFCAAHAAAGHRSGRDRVCLVAVGGYGRGILGLHSDIDVVFLCDDPTDRFVVNLVEAWLYPLWDLGFDIGHAVRGVDETIALAREDIRTATTLLDLRRVSGDESILSELRESAREEIFGPELLEVFLDTLQKDTANRHERFGGSLYLLEPNMKLGRGGLRDVDVVHWTAQARWNVSDLADLVECGVLSRREWSELDAAAEMLWRVRNLLHVDAGRRHDRLTFVDQEDASIELGFVDAETLGVEQFMQVYYRHARVVALTAERILQRARLRIRSAPERFLRLGDGTVSFDHQIRFEDSSALSAKPCLALRLYSQVLRLEEPPDSTARDLVVQRTVEPAFREELRGSPEAAKLFLSLLTHVSPSPMRCGSVLLELLDVGLITAMIPEFEPLIARVQHDVYNVYTIDVHSILAVDWLRRLRRGEMAGDLPLSTRLAAETPRLAPLHLAILLHELGTSIGGHPARDGARPAGVVAARFGLSAVDVEHVVWLVQESLSFHHWATRRDTSDPDALAEF
ncbi:MAG: [protein-PII] uridylyltransferase, partial [Myxococcota bacterium]